MYAIGVGENVDSDALKQMCTDDRAYFPLENFQAFVREVKLTQDEASARAAQFLAIDFEPASTEMRSNKPIELNVIVRNNSASEDLVAGQKITFERNEYFEPCEFIIEDVVPHGGQARTKIRLNPKASAKESDFPGEIEYTFQHGRITHRGTITLATGTPLFYPIFPVYRDKRVSFTLPILFIPFSEYSLWALFL